MKKYVLGGQEDFMMEVILNKVLRHSANSKEDVKQNN